MDNFDKLYNKALRFLSFRPRSEKELRDYLSGKARSRSARKIVSEESLINSIIEKLKKDRFLNDEEFTRWWVEQRTLIKPRACRVIKFELKQKGIAKDLIDSLFENDEGSDFIKALKLAEKKMVRLAKIEDKRKVYEKLGRFLASKGFNWDTIKEVIDQILKIDK